MGVRSRSGGPGKPLVGNVFLGRFAFGRFAFGRFAFDRFAFDRSGGGMAEDVRCLRFRLQLRSVAKLPDGARPSALGPSGDG
jgi:hypothetical protein